MNKPTGIDREKLAETIRMFQEKGQHGTSGILLEILDCLVPIETNNKNPHIASSEDKLQLIEKLEGLKGKRIIEPSHTLLIEQKREYDNRIDALINEIKGKE